MARLRPRPTPRVPWAWAATGAACGLLLACVLWAPARWLAAAVAQASSERVQLVQAEGTVWDGSARLLLSGGRGTTNTSTLPSPVHWRLRPHWGGLALHLAAPCCQDGSWRWRATLDGFGLVLQADDLASAASHWPAAVLSGLGTPWNTVQLQGTLAVHTQDLRVTLGAQHWALQGHAAVDAVGVRTVLSTLQPLGSYRLAIEGGAQPALTLSTLEGALQLSGQGELVQGRWRFRGEARSEAAAQSALGNLLNIIGRRDGARSVITVG